MHCSISQETRPHQFPLLSRSLTPSSDVFQTYPVSDYFWEVETLFSYRLKISVVVF